MAYQTPNLKLKKPAQGDFYDVDDFNGNMDILDEVITSFDCGNWDETDIATAIAAHDANPLAHPTLIVDGGATFQEVAEQLEKHDNDETAHQNNEIDGGIV